MALRSAVDRNKGGNYTDDAGGKSSWDEHICMIRLMSLG